MQRARASDYVVMALCAGSMLMHEILLTRVCALRLYFHFAFLVISHCLLALGASGALLLLLRERVARAPRAWLVGMTSAYAVSLVVTYAALLRFPLPANLDLLHGGHLWLLSAFNLVAAVPFLFGGFVVALLLTSRSEDVERLYAVDLLGAGLGCIACPLLLPWLGAGGVLLTTVAAALVALAVASCWPLLRAAAVGLAVVSLWAAPSLDARMPVPSKGQTDLVDAGGSSTPAVHSVWTSNSRIDVMRMPQGVPAGVCMRGRNREGLPPDPPWAGIAQDSVAGTALLDFTGHPEALSILARTPYSAAFALRPHGDALIIGLGGGNDVWAALAAPMRSVKAIELNAPIVQLHRERLRDYSSALVDDPRVLLVVDEGRSALMREPRSYDVVQMTGIDTWTALASGAYVLAENYLYTTEAVAAMYSRLKPGGVLQISRFSATMEALRLLSNIHAALASLGVSDMAASLAVLTTPDSMMSVQLKRGRFSRAEQALLSRFARDGGIDIAYLPDAPGSGPVSDFIRSPNKQRIIDDFPMNIGPTTDDRPYFFNYLKWQHPLQSRAHLHDIPSVSQGNPLLLLGQFGLALLWSALFIIVPVLHRGVWRVKGAWSLLGYFAALGLGFVMVEIAAIQKLTLFLGQPVYSLTVTLCSLLWFTGLGALVFAKRFDLRSAHIGWVAAAIAVAIGVFCVAAKVLVLHAMGLQLSARIALAALALAPLGVLLGIPFAYGMRVLAATRPELTPWAWAINGCFSVVGSVLSVIVSMNFGFYAVLAAAACVYAAGFGALASRPR